MQTQRCTLTVLLPREIGKLIHLSSHALDHLPILLQTQRYRKQRSMRGRGFKFEETWLLWEDYEAVVEGAWNKCGNVGNGLANIKQKIEVCGVELKAWGVEKANPDKIIKQLQKK